LDVSKAFDNERYTTLFEKLNDLGLPKYYLELIKAIYLNQNVRVKYGASFSEKWSIKCGVRQGGILSPLLFNVYINELINKLSKCNFGCKLGITSSNVIGYADDLVLLAPTAAALQLLINKASSELANIDLSFNSSKSKVIIFKR
jgi:retron-type reverse transcriptase